MEIEEKSQTQGIEFTPRLKQEIQDILNTQIYNEIISSHIYKAMACWLDNAGYPNIAKVFMDYGNEEQTHANKVIDYLFDKNCKPIIPEVDKQEDMFESVREIVEKGLEHEIVVTGNWEDIATLAKNVDDNTTYFLSQWFINEQIGEENKHRNVLYYMNQGGTLWYLDQNAEEIFKA